MPTGYTADIKDGISFEQYAMNCARNFGALVMMRDEPKGAEIPKEFEPSTYSKDALAKAQKELHYYYELTDQYWQKLLDQDFEQSIERYENGRKEEAETLAKYNAMLEKAKAYVAPTPEHVNYAKFLVSQIEESIEWDCNYYTSEKHRPVKKSLEDFKASKIAQAKKDIEYHSDSYKKEVERTNERNKWISDLRKSLNL